MEIKLIAVIVFIFLTVIFIVQNYAIVNVQFIV